MFLLIIDAHSKWLQVYPIAETFAATITLLRKSFATFGRPEVIASDNVSNFTSKKFETLLLYGSGAVLKQKFRHFCLNESFTKFLFHFWTF